MFGDVRGASRTMILVILAVVVVAGAGIYLMQQFGGGSDMMRTFHCNACGKDFTVDLSKPGMGKPTCASCSSPNVTMVKKGR